ncbi:MAG: undecaprenyl-diphosphate phosphatase [Patescibacteria group bacterium]
MSILQAIILGIIQGIGEFLPISSSGHLIIVPYIFGWNYQGLNFDIALHFGTLLAILIYFWRDWSKIISDGISLEKIEMGNENKKTNHISQTTFLKPNLLWIILVASIPAAIAGYFLENLAEHALRNPLLVAVLLAVFGTILWITDYTNRGQKKIGQINYLQGFIIGIGQALAIFPGVSRSGSTATFGMLLNFDRETATKFSFIISVPITIGAFALSLKSFDPSMIDVSFLVAILTSTAFGVLSIKFLLKYIANHNYFWFFIYRLGLAGLILLIYYFR